MKYWILRKMYELAYWFCDKTAPPEAPVLKGFYTRFQKPSEVKDEDLEVKLRTLLNEALRD